MRNYLEMYLPDTGISVDLGPGQIGPNRFPRARALQFIMQTTVSDSARRSTIPCGTSIKSVRDSHFHRVSSLSSPRSHPLASSLLVNGVHRTCPGRLPTRALESSPFYGTLEEYLSTCAVSSMRVRYTHRLSILMLTPCRLITCAMLE